LISQYIEAYQITSGQPLLPRANNDFIRRYGSDLVNIKEMEHGEDALLSMLQNSSSPDVSERLAFVGSSSASSFIKQTTDFNGAAGEKCVRFLDFLKPAGVWEVHAVSEHIADLFLNFAELTS
jgi:hypothetical protein